MLRTSVRRYLLAPLLGLAACDRPSDQSAVHAETASVQQPDSMAAYTLLHIVGNEAGSEWSVDTAAVSDAAMAMAEGDTAYFAEPADPIRDWQRARVKRINAVRWVHPSDFFAP